MKRPPEPLPPTRRSNLLVTSADRGASRSGSVKSAVDHVLGSFAVMAYLDDEVGAGEVQRLIEASDRLDVLVTLIEAYEEKHHPIYPPDPVEAILFRMEQQGLSRKDLEPYIGARGRVSEILSRTRSLTLPMIRRLHEGLGIPAEILIQEIRSSA